MISRRLLLLSAVASARGRLRRFDASHLPASAVLLIPGSGGVGAADVAHAKALADEGFVAFVPPGRVETVGAVKAMIDEVVREVPGVMGLFAYSQGGSLALAAAAGDERCGAVVVWSGNLRDDAYEDLRRLPPTLLIHGSADAVIPVADARQVMALCEERQIPCRLREFDGEGHHFSRTAERSAIGETVGFLRAHLAMGRR